MRGMTRVVGSRQRGLALLGGLARLHKNTPNSTTKYNFDAVKTLSKYSVV